MNQEEYISNRLEDQINWYDTKSTWNQKWFKRLQVYQFIAAALIPVMVIYVREEFILMRLLVALTGASIAIISGIIGLYKLQENWLEYRTTCESLQHEKYLYLSCSEPYNIEDPFPLLVSRVETLISKENTNWTQYMRKVPKEKKCSVQIPAGHN